MAILSFSLLSFLCLFLITIFTSHQANADNNGQNFHYFCDNNNDRGNYITNSVYHKNLKTALFLLTNTRIDSGFRNVSFGETTDKVNAIGLCRGDVKPDDCLKCLSGSSANLTQLCPNRKEAIGWYEDEKCMLRYSDRYIAGLNEIGPAYFVWNLHNATLADQFNKVVIQLLDSLRTTATSGDSRRKYAVGNVQGPSSDQTIYGLVQCTPDLSGPQCDNCLVQSIIEVPRCCSNRIGARIIRPSCNLRFETSFQFYDPTAPPLQPHGDHRYHAPHFLP